MSILKTIAGFVIVLAVALAAIGTLLPRDITVDRSVVIAATPDQVFPHVNSLKNFNAWSPWAKRDPDTRYVFEGPEQGIGAKMLWKSDHPDVGSGIQEITESIANKRVRMALDFGDMGTAVASYRLEPEEGGTKVTWGFETDLGNNIMWRYFGLMMDRWVGTEYEKGLANLKQLVENPSG